MFHSTRLSGRVAIVTGAGRGIGAAIALRFAREGAQVVVVDIDDDVAESSAATIVAEGGAAWPVPMDVSSEEAWTALQRELTRRQLSPDTLVHCAFTVRVLPIHAQSSAEWDRQLGVDLSAVHRSMRALWPQLSETAESAARPVAMILISSVHAMVGLPGHPAYAASKAGLVALARQMSVDYGPRLRVNAILPGPIRTRAWDGVVEETIESARRQTTLGRMGTPDEVAAAAAFLASDDASFITGASLLVDGGWSAGREGR